MGSGGDKDGIDAVTKKYKKRFKRMCLCSVFWVIFAIISLVIGITLLVHFSEYWGDETQWKRGLAYFGVALLLLFILSLAIGVVLCVILRKIYTRMNGGDKKGFGKMFKPKKYAAGKAPYPQQPPEPPQRTVPPAEAPDSPSKQPLQPGPPQQPSAPPGKLDDVNIEVQDHARF